jgi:hypothetical protein
MLWTRMKRKTLVHIQFFDMKVSIACRHIFTDNTRPIPPAWVSTVPVVETSQRIVQAVFDSSQSIDCRADVPNVRQVSFIMEAGYRIINICGIPKICCPLHLFSSEGHGYEGEVKQTITTMELNKRYVGKVMGFTFTFPWCRDLCSRRLQMHKT